MSNKCNDNENGKIFISKDASKKITYAKNRDIFIHEVSMKNRKGFDDLKETTEAMSKVVTQLLESVPKLSDSCHCEREAVTCCYTQHDYKGLNCSEEIKQFVECARARSEGVVASLLEERPQQEQYEDSEDDDEIFT